MTAKDVIQTPQPQESFKKLFRSEARYLVCYGGAAAGKSYAAAQKALAYAWIYPQSRVIVIRKFGPSLRLTCWKLLLDLIRELKYPVSINHTELRITFPNRSEIQLIPVVNTTGEAADRIKSLTDVSFMWLEEPTELTRAEFEMIKLRLRGRPLRDGFRQMLLTFNPIDQTHWLNDYFFQHRQHGSETQLYTYKDNAHLDEEYKRSLEELEAQDTNLYNVYALGLWGRLEHAIYSHLSVDDFGYINFDEIIGGCDFGFENPSAFLLIGLKEKTAYLIAEVYKRKLINAEFISRIKRCIQTYVPKESEYGAEQRVPIYADSAEPARIEEMHQAGLLVYPAEKNVLDGINTVKSYEIVIHDRCENSKKELRGYQRRVDKNGNILEDPVKANDHLCDCARYALYTHGRKAGPSMRLLWDDE